MSQRGAGFAFLLLLIFSTLLLGCSKGSAPAGPGIRITLEVDVSQTPDVDVETALSMAADIIGRSGGPGVKVSVQDGNRLSVELPDITAAEASRLFSHEVLFEFRQPKLDDNTNILTCQGGKVTYNPPGCEGGQELGVPPQSLTVRSAESVIWVPALATDGDGRETALTGHFLKPNTFVSSDPVLGTPILNFEMTSEGAPLLEQVTTRLLGLPMTFFLDGEPIRGEEGGIMAPTVRAPISDKGIIEGLSAGDARMLSIQLNAGAMPAPLKVIEVEELGD